MVSGQCATKSLSRKACISSIRRIVYHHAKGVYIIKASLVYHQPKAVCSRQRLAVSCQRELFIGLTNYYHAERVYHRTKCAYHQSARIVYHQGRALYIISQRLYVAVSGDRGRGRVTDKVAITHSVYIIKAEICI